MVSGPNGKPVPFELRPSEIEEIRAALDGTSDGHYRTVVFCWPRRHGKTVASALIILWRFLTRTGQGIAIVANSQKQTIDTAFKTIRDLILATPYFARLVNSGAIVIQGEQIAYGGLKNIIQGYTSNPAALYGKKLSIAQVSELHAAANDDAYQVLASCTADSADGLTLVDSTVGSRSSPLFGLYSIAQAGSDPALYYSHIFYRDLDDACANSPPWITERAIRSRAAQMLPAEFAQQHLNLWQSGSNALFPPSILDECVEAYPLTPEGIAEGASYRVGAGLDRAAGFSLHGDATATTCLLKVLRGEDEHYYVLDSSGIPFSTAGGIKKAFQRY
jgi:phage terminase large subunit-like protein